MADLVGAYHGVYTSSMEIVKNKQTHLYVNMLDLLTRTTKTASTSSKDHITDEYIKFWYTDILPLVFHEDLTIQDNAVTAIETMLHYVDVSNVQLLPEWPAIKKTILEEYSTKLHGLRQVSNSNWCKVWCILLQILEKDAIRGTAVINIFLSIVEKAFRSTDYKVRAEAHICWKFLIEILAKHNEINSPKRVKLICIPLKSSQSKTLDIAINKFKAWWYFLCKLNDKIENYHDIAFESFLLFCFGGEKCSNQMLGRNYAIVKQMAISCLIEMLGPSSKNAQYLLETNGLHKPDKTLITTSLMLKSGKAIVSACFEATVTLAETNVDRNKQFYTLWGNLLCQIRKTNNIELYVECCKQMKALANSTICTNESQLRLFLQHILEAIGTDDHFPFKNFTEISDQNCKLCEVILDITELITNVNVKCPNNVAEKIVHVIYNIERYKNSNKYWNMQNTLIDSTVESNNENPTVKMCIWRTLTECLVNYLNDRIFEFRISKKADVVNKWLFWPLEQFGNTDLIDEVFLNSWKNLVLAASKAEGSCNFVRAVAPLLKSLFEKEDRISKLPELLAIFVGALDVSFDKISKPQEAFDVINYALSKIPKPGETHNKIITALNEYITSLKENQIIDIFDNFKTICLTLHNNLNKNSFTKYLFEDLKKGFCDKLKGNKAKEKKMLKEFKDLFKSDSNSFIIIPTPWSFNPDKLTEHQKEKMKEKRSDIPALYNDISHASQSQESIKPWTPKRVVIAKGENSEEIVLENKNKDNLATPTEPITNAEFLENDNANSALDKSDVVLNTSTNPVAFDNCFKEIPETDKPQTSEPSEKTSSNKITEKNNLKYSKCEELLKTFNVQVDDEKRKAILMRQLKSIHIDTNEGKSIVLNHKLRSKRNRKKDEDKSGLIHSSEAKRIRSVPDATKKDDEDSANSLKNSQKSLTHEKRVNSENDTENIPSEDTNATTVASSKNESLEEVVECSQEPSQSLLAKKISLRKSIDAINKSNSPNRSSLKFINDDSECNSEDKNDLTNCESIVKILTPNKMRGRPKNSSNCAIHSEPEKHDEGLKFAVRKSISPNGKTKQLTITEMNGVSLFSDGVDLNKKTDETIKICNDVCGFKESQTLAVTPRKSPLNRKDEEIVLASNELVETTCPQKDSIISSPCPNHSEGHSIIIESDKDSQSIANQNIISSPLVVDIDERNDEFLNSTLNISPIEETDENCCNNNQIAGKTEAIRRKESTQKINMSETDKLICKNQEKILNNLQSSPPDRKSIMNTESPKVKPKHIPQLTGRGAQFINMIRNKKLEIASKIPANVLTPVQIENKSSPDKANLEQNPQQNSQNIDEEIAPQSKQFLIFSKTLPSPYASPSASILKRKYRHDSLDEIELQMNKRKRVSFHDPPVSVTKEYVKHAEEVRPSFTRCLMPDKTSTPQNLKQSFIRKNRVDSMIEIAKFSEYPVAATLAEECTANCSTTIDHNTGDMETLKWNVTGESINPTDDGGSLTPSPSLYFPDEAAVCEYVFEKHSFEEILEKYLASGRRIGLKSIRTITNSISSAMSEDVKLKTNVLELLSEKHPKEFLDHAIQENLSSVVCDRLNPSSVIEFVCEKSKINTGMRKRLLEQVKSMINEKLISDEFEFLTSLLENHQMTDAQVIECISVIVQQQKKHKEEFCNNSPLAISTSLN